MRFLRMQYLTIGASSMPCNSLNEGQIADSYGKWGIYSFGSLWFFYGHTQVKRMNYLFTRVQFSCNVHPDELKYKKKKQKIYYRRKNSQSVKYEKWRNKNLHHVKWFRWGDTLRRILRLEREKPIKMSALTAQIVFEKHNFDDFGGNWRKLYQSLGVAKKFSE